MSAPLTREVRRRKGTAMSAKNSDTKTKYCSVCGEPASDIICDRCKAKIQGEAVNKKQQVEREVKTDTSRK
jgi:predicted amidophosphoribosyltransferase